MTALTPAQKERMKAANSRASKIRTGIVGYLETLAVIAVAYREEDHLALGYDTWDDYVEAEFGADRMRIPMEHRRKAVTELRLAGMSTRQIGDTLGVTRNTVKNDLREVGQVDPPEAVKGRDGKRYSPARSPLVEAMTGAIEDADARNETAGLAGPAPDAEQASVASGTAPGGDTCESPSGAPRDVPDAVNVDAGPDEAAAVQPAAASLSHPGSSSPGEAEPVRGVATEPGSAGAASAPAPAAGGPATTQPPAATDPLDEVLGAIDAIAAQTGICPACQRPLT